MMFLLPPYLSSDEPLYDLEAEVDNLGILGLAALDQRVEDLVGEVGGRGLGQAGVPNLLNPPRRNTRQKFVEKFNNSTGTIFLFYFLKSYLYQYRYPIHLSLVIYVINNKCSF